MTTTTGGSEISSRPWTSGRDTTVRRTTTITQLDTTKLLVIVNSGGGIVVSDGVATVGYLPATNLVVRGSDALTLLRLEVQLHEARPGSLTLDLPGFNAHMGAGAMNVS